MIKIKPLVWSEPTRPNSSYPYDHVIAKTLVGTYCIEWKSWKEFPDYQAGIDWNTDFGAIADTLDEAKSAAQADYEARIMDAIEYEMVEFVDEKPPAISEEGMEKVREFIESFHFTVSERSFYKDVGLHLHKPNSLVLRINNDSSKSWIFSDLEQRRKAALSALQREVE